jgi:hypothetical protein
MNKLLKKILISIVTLMSIFSCSKIEPKIYQQNSLKFDIRNFFKGDLQAYGILQDRSGKVIKTFTVKMHGSWKENEGILKEDFIFSDQKTDHREWKISIIDDHNFTAQAHDVVGHAKGQQYGNAVRMQYILTIPVNQNKYNFKIDDWMYLVDQDSLINTSTIKKFGFKMATLTIAFKKIGL